MSLLLLFGGSPPVTSTASFGQAAGTWAATAAETIPTTAAWNQTAVWSATASEAILGTAAFTQTAIWSAAALEEITNGTTPFNSPVTYNDTDTLYGGEVIPAAWSQTATWAAEASADDAPTEVTSTASWVQAAGAWQASASESIPATASFTQLAVWDATVTETVRDPVQVYSDAGTTYNAAVPYDGGTSATWSQTAAWSALGEQAEDVDAEAAFEQPKASWQAATSQLATGTATWSQNATWDSALEQAFGATAAFSQAPAAWSAEGSEEVTAEATWEQAEATWQASEGALITGTATWEQTQAWDATATHTESVVEQPVTRGGYRPPRRIRGTSEVVFVGATASFTQAPASWHAVMTTRRSREQVDVDELLLVGAL